MPERLSDILTSFIAVRGELCEVIDRLIDYYEKTRPPLAEPIDGLPVTDPVATFEGAVTNAEPFWPPSDEFTVDENPLRVDDPIVNSVCYDGVPGQHGTLKYE